MPSHVCWVSDLHQLNKIFYKVFRAQVFTKLDVNMQSYTFALDKESQDLCTIIMPFHKYKYA
ncbi:hypothetical protein ACHAW6_005053 [Cyclotella cf. meneghiniana]